MESGKSTGQRVMNKTKFILTFFLILSFIYPPHYRAEGFGLIANSDPDALPRRDSPLLPVYPATDATKYPGQPITAEIEAKAPAPGGPWYFGSTVALQNAVAGDIPLVAAGNDPSVNLPDRGAQTAPAVTASLTITAETVTSVPLYPVLATPPTESMLGKGLVAFTWTEVPGTSAYRYRIQISKNARFTPTAINTVVKTGAYKTRTALPSGVYYWRVRAEDKVKKGGTWSPSWKFTIDAKAPTNTTIKKFVNGGKKVTTAAKVSLAISAKDNIGVTAYHVSERKKKPAASDPDWVAIVSAKSYSARVGYEPPDKRDGKKMIYVRFKDAAGNISETKSGTIILHTSKPETTITHQPAKLTNSTSANFGFVSDKRGARFLCSLDDGEYTACVLNSMAYKDLAEGPHTFNVKGIDNVGNAEETPASYAWTIDTMPPDTAISTQPSLTSKSATASFGFLSTKVSSAFFCKLDDGAYGECVSPLTYSALAEGLHTFAVRAMDEAGNSDPTPASYAWTITLFQTTITGQPSDPSNSTTAIFSLATRRSGATYQCKLDNADYSACTSPVIYSGLTEGSHSFSAKAIDEAENEESTPAQYNWVINLPPIVKSPSRFINVDRSFPGYLTNKNTIKLLLAADSAKGVAGYYISESPAKPDASDPAWVKIPPTKVYSKIVPFTMSESKGTKTVYVWFKDVEGALSEGVHDSIYLFNSNTVFLVFILIQVAFLL
jgi:hypothetical protein